jgi:hypothetical protein
MEKKDGVYSVAMKLLEGETVTGDGESILGAVADAELKQGKKLFLGQMKLFVIGDGLTDLAGDLNVFLSGDICPACPVVYAESPAEIVGGGADPADILAALNVYASQGKSVITPLTTLAGSSVGIDTAAVVPIAATTDADEGAVTFSGLRLIGRDYSDETLSDEDALGLKLLCGGLDPSDKVTVTTITDGAVISGEILSGKTKWHLSSDLSGETPLITADITLIIKADITEKPADMPENTAVRAIEDYAAGVVMQAYENVARRQHTDAFGFGNRVRKSLPRTYNQYKQNPKRFLEESILRITIAGR